MIEFVWPQTTGEWLAWVSAFYLLSFGVVLLLAPRQWLATFQTRFGLNDTSAMQTSPAPALASASLMRAMGGGNFGLALAVMALHPQPLLYLALAATFVFRVVGRVLSVLIDKARSRTHWIILVVEAILGYFALGYAFGLIR
jgi:hypothetical protein